MKKTWLICIIFICTICLITFKYINGNWTIRYKSNLNQFFGEGNWECISKETKDSIIYSKYVKNSSREVPGKYQNWYIRFNSRNGTEKIYKISDHALKFNNDKYGLFSSKRYSRKQALYLELMDISFEVVGEEIFNEIIRSELPEKEANCIAVYMSYHGGNPKPKIYDALSKEPWFTVDRVTAEDYLSSDLYDFYIDIKGYDYKLDKLLDQERQNLFDSLKNIEIRLLEKYGDKASFRIYFDEENQVEYIDGRKK